MQGRKGNLRRRPSALRRGGQLGRRAGGRARLRHLRRPGTRRELRTDAFPFVFSLSENRLLSAILTY